MDPRYGRSGCRYNSVELQTVGYDVELPTDDSIAPYLFVVAIHASTGHNGDEYLGVVKGALAALSHTLLEGYRILITTVDSCHIGILNLGNEVSSISYIPWGEIAGKSPVGINLSDIASFTTVNSKSRFSILRAVDNLTSNWTMEEESSGDSSARTNMLGMVDVLLPWLATCVSSGIISGCRVLNIVSSLRSQSLPSSSFPSTSSSAEHEWKFNIKSSAYLPYCQNAAEHGVSFDVYAVREDTNDATLDVQALSPLIMATGGKLLVYDSIAAATQLMPLDMKALCDQHSYGWSASLRLNTSPYFTVSDKETSCHWVPAKSRKAEWHISSLFSQSTFAVDLVFRSNSSSFISKYDSSPVVQMVLIYNTLVPVTREGTDSHSGECRKGDQSGNEERCYRYCRRMRTITKRFDSGETTEEVMSHCQLDAVATLLLHKLIKAAVQNSDLAESRQLVVDWLIVLCAKTNSFLFTTRYGHALDITFSLYPGLSLLLRIVWGLKNNQLLDAKSDRDRQAALYVLSTTLSPSHLLNFVYPKLESWASLDGPVVSERLALCKTAILNAHFKNHGEVFLLNACTHMVVYIPHLITSEFFPSSESLSAAVSERGRSVSYAAWPRTHHTSANEDLSLPYCLDLGKEIEEYLIDDRGYFAWLNDVKIQVERYMKSEGMMF
jgi:hypothetical protein